ncbi:acyltransferase [Vibrio sp. qd031]|uniref:acyltransferase n=1 Tax=Vibrio sp. qd031 TaxID=1603038 RepID=UPI000A10D5C3|nr:acyltransferase [Vibrio sp. qd031]ORT51425.1 acyltransferase [Vibrio sp. qd031]
MHGYLILVATSFLVIVNTAIISLLICIIALIKVMTPTLVLKRYPTALANQLMWVWATLNAGILRLFNRVEWDISGVDNLSKHGWYLMISNHRSWTDIVVLCCVFKDRIPMPKFFMKQQLLYIPLMGMACWALGMPFMKRYSREYLLRHPEKRGEDLRTTRRSCEQFKHTPTTVVNYVEGTRCTKQKLATSKAGYQHLLQPKSGGIAYTLAAMGEQFDSILDVTLAYPQNVENPFRDMLMGRMNRIVVHVTVRPIDEHVLGDYFNDKPYKRRFQHWLSDVWEEKDRLLEKHY